MYAHDVWNLSCAFPLACNHLIKIARSCTGKKLNFFYWGGVGATRGTEHFSFIYAARILASLGFQSKRTMSYCRGHKGHLTLQLHLR